MGNMLLAESAKALRTSPLKSRARSYTDIMQDEATAAVASALPATFPAESIGRPSGKKRTYTDAEAAWARGDAPPKELRLQRVQAALSVIGPLVVEKSHLDDQVKELQKARDACDASTNTLHRTKLEHVLGEKRAAMAGGEAELKDAIARMQEVTLETARAIAPQLADDRRAYRSAIERMRAEEPGALETLTARAAELLNRGPLNVGDVVETVAEGTLTRARVQGVVTSRVGHGGEQGGASDGDRTGRGGKEDSFELSLWNEFMILDLDYSIGFDTALPKLVTRARTGIYASHKHPQQLSDAAQHAAEQVSVASVACSRDGGECALGTGAPLPNSTEFLLLLYADAERTMPHLHALGERIEASVAAKAIVAPLKGAARACAKTLEKYRSDFSRLTDLARMTFECETLTGALAVLNALATDGAFTLLLLKNRLMLAFDADPTGGYRDLLLNLRCNATGHIAEVQITLVPLLRVKTGGGHAAYALARLLHLNEIATYRHEGALGHRNLTAVSSGLVRELRCAGTVGLTEHMDALVGAMRSQTCLLDVLILSGCDWPSAPISPLLNAAMCIGPRLKELELDHMVCSSGKIEIPHAISKCTALLTLGLYDSPIEGTIPPALCSICGLQELRLNANRLTGTIPDAIGDLSSLFKLHLQNNSLTGEIPHAIGKCHALRELGLQNNKFTGSIPPTLGQCTVLQALVLGNNQLSGPIPDIFGQLPKLEMLRLNGNRLSGPIPASLGLCLEIKDIRLSSNELSGTIPASLGQCTKLTKVALEIDGNQLTGPVPSALRDLIDPSALGVLST